jgi:hypothetical protein
MWWAVHLLGIGIGVGVGRELGLVHIGVLGVGVVLEGFVGAIHLGGLIVSGGSMIPGMMIGSELCFLENIRRGWGAKSIMVFSRSKTHGSSEHGCNARLVEKRESWG